MSGPSYHGRTHLPEGTDPIPGLALAREVLWLPYTTAFRDQDDNELGPDGSPWILSGPLDNETSIAWYFLDPPGLGVGDPGTALYGQASGTVRGTTGVSGITKVRLWPSGVSSSPSDSGPFMYGPLLAGFGVFARPDGVGGYSEWHPLQLMFGVDDGYSLAPFLSDGSRLSGTNPVDWEIHDVISCTWVTKVDLW